MQIYFCLFFSKHDNTAVSLLSLCKQVFKRLFFEIFKVKLTLKSLIYRSDDQNRSPVFENVGL